MKISIFWHRRDLRIHDNAGLYHALKESPYPVLPLFIFDSNILNDLTDKKDARVTFIYQQVELLNNELIELGSSLLTKVGTPLSIWQSLCSSYEIATVYTNKDYEPYSNKRDEGVAEYLQQLNISFKSYKDHVIFEEQEITKKDGLPYTVFTPYKKQWLAKLQSRTSHTNNSNATTKEISYYLKPYPNGQYFDNFMRTNKFEVPNLQTIGGFQQSYRSLPSKIVNQKVIQTYHLNRDYPSIEGTSKLGIHFRFGTISIREKALKASILNETYLSELIWRDFYAMILANFPKVVTKSYKEKYENIAWRNNEKEFKKWCKGLTGYPIVDAGMRELNQTGYMHNRVRMIVASFLTKHLLIDWRWGEAYFAHQLLDYELASNNGGWQWAAGCGTDAAPYFRIFNPYTQAKKFDKKNEYINKWVPELLTSAYPEPIVEHKFARQRCLSTFKEGLNNIK